MSATQVPVRESTRLFGELLAVHAVMVRGAELVGGSFTRLACGADVDTKTLVATARWLVAFVRHHLDAGGEILRPALGACFPGLVHRFDRLAEEDHTLVCLLDDLERVLLRIAQERKVGGSVDWGHAMKEGTLASHRIQDELARHRAAEEPQLRWLFAKAPDEDLPGLRKAVTDGLPRSGAHLVFGLLAHPEPLPGADRVCARFPAPVHLTRGMLVSRFRRTLRDLAAE
ncbi:hemerythrin domain-containing protein [Streptomyces sp. NPDC001068]|uniref:hemerythrin domain-containing protein n=1 Tax=Streptomyces sp. NPDC001068 TaxID=3364544 RepID=UPI0036A3DF2F